VPEIPVLILVDFVPFYKYSLLSSITRGLYKGPAYCVGTIGLCLTPLLQVSKEYSTSTLILNNDYNAYITSNTSNPLEKHTAYEIIPHAEIGRANQYGIV
jgi:hypothetical protein